MNKIEAQDILTKELEVLRLLPYEELAEKVIRGVTETKEITSISGIWYQIEIQYFWDNTKLKTVRVMGSIDDGGWRAFKPLCDSFIKARDGTFIGE